MISEVDNYLTRIEDLRGQVSSLLAELPSEALNWRPIESAGDHATNSLASLAAHIAGAEHFWIGEVEGGQPKTREEAKKLFDHLLRQGFEFELVSEKVRATLKSDSEAVDGE